MSTVSPTLLPRASIFPLLLPDVPKPHPTPLPPKAAQPPGRLSSRRNLRNEMEDLSDEEDDIEESWKEAISHRGFSFLHVIGRLYTQQEEKNDQADSLSEETSSQRSAGPASVAEEGGEGSQADVDLDAGMEDLDDADGRNETFGSEEGDGDDEDEEDLDNDIDEDEDL